ncbi:MAG: serine hydrolase [Actinomycetota bacterium]|nr:serine hydrolase [Actinomycetota bacterium]
MLTALLPAVAVVVAITAAAATPALAGSEPVGGPRLGTSGTVSANGAPGLPAAITASSWLVADLDTGEVLAARDPHGRYLPASTLKILTAVTEIPRLDPDSKASPTAEDVAVDGNKAPLEVGAAYPVRDLFGYLLVRSANDAANTLARIDGGRANTLDRMSREARHLHADDTNPLTPSGLDASGESTSAYDLALIARAALGIPEFARLVSAQQLTVTGPAGAPTSIRPENKLLAQYPGAIGVKTGYTLRAGGTFVGAARRDGHTLVVTLLHATPGYFPEAERLLDWGFSADGRFPGVGRLVDPAPGLAPNDPRAADPRPTGPVAGGTPLRHHSTAWQLPALAGAAVVLVAAGTALLLWRRRKR